MNSEILDHKRSDELSEKDRERQSELGEIKRKILSVMPQLHENVNTRKICFHEFQKGFLEEKPIRRGIIYLRSSGCPWMLKDKNGGCFMCGHLFGTTFDKPITADDYKAQFDGIIGHSDFAEIPMLSIYNAGSFFNDEELPADARKYICDRLNEIPHIKHVIFESRPEYINDEKLTVLRESIPNKGIEIGFGLESSNKLIRDVCVNKGFSERIFLTAIDVLKRYNISPLAYVLLKPPFLTEAMAIEDAISSIEWAFSKGVDVVSLEPISVQKYTLIHLLYRLNKYRPPWIWSVLRVISEVGKKGLLQKRLLRIGGYEYYPQPFQHTHNCNVCTKSCEVAIDQYNATNKMTVIEDALKNLCNNCKDQYEKQLAENMTIENAIDDSLVKLKPLNESEIASLLQQDVCHNPNVLTQIDACGL